MPDPGSVAGGLGTPDELRAHLRKFAEVGVDQVIFIQQGGRNRHEHICESLELFAAEVMPDFKEGVDERELAKRERLAPDLEAAMRRKKFMPPIADEEIPAVRSYGRNISATPASTPGAGIPVPSGQ